MEIRLQTAFFPCWAWADASSFSAWRLPASVLEIAGGMRLLIQTSSASFARDVSMAVLAGFGGLSILTQNHLFLQVCGVTQGRLLCLALLRALMSGAVMAILLWLI